MDVSWRIGMEMRNHSGRRSTDGAAPNRRSRPLDAGDFADVFGGPPRSVSGIKSSARSINSGSFYDEIFQVTEIAAPAKKTGRSLRAFSIPVEKDEEFYSDIFGNDGIGRPMHRSRTSKSALSSDELSPLRSASSEDVEMSQFASELRPINTPCKWNSSTMKPDFAKNPKNRRSMPSAFSYNSPSGSENQYMESFAYMSSYQGFSSQNVSSPDITSLNPKLYRATKVSLSDFDLQSSSSGRSSLCQEWEDKGNDTMHEQNDDDEEESMSPYVIEIKSDHYREVNDDGIDEAVAWAKESYQRHRPEKDAKMQERTKECVRTEHSSIPLAEMELKLLEKEVELWSSGKTSNIRLLLSTLQQILWLDSSWHAIPLINLIDRSRVKKAYKKAQLCLHPDKVQQRGATCTQKFIAAKVFAILQDAWDAFITQDGLLTRGG